MHIHRALSPSVPYRPISCASPTHIDPDICSKPPTAGRGPTRPPSPATHRHPLSVPLRNTIPSTLRPSASSVRNLSNARDQDGRSRCLPSCASGLDRDLDPHGTPEYAREELVAELGSALLFADLGIAATPPADHASYIASWLKLLADEPRAVFDAATQAQRAAEFLHTLHDANAPEAAAA